MNKLTITFRLLKMIKLGDLRCSFFVLFCCSSMMKKVIDSNLNEMVKRVSGSKREWTEQSDCLNRLRVKWNADGKMRSDFVLFRVNWKFLFMFENWWKFVLLMIIFPIFYDKLIIFAENILFSYYNNIKIFK